MQCRRTSQRKAAVPVSKRKPHGAYFLTGTTMYSQTKKKQRLYEMELRMRPVTFFFSVIGTIGLAAALDAQVPRQPGMPPPQPEPPLLYVKLIGPSGMQVTFYRGTAKAQTFDAPATIGLRPGYSYRLAITGVAGFEKDAFYPTLEVHGSLLLGGKLRNADFPAALVFTAEDFAKVIAAAVVKKVVVLERPDGAIPEATKVDDPIEINLQPNRDPVAEARSKGVALIVLQMGGRQFTSDEMAAQSVPGTLLLPGEKALGAPGRAPSTPWAAYLMFDPLVGAANPADLTTFHDGGDVDLPAGVTRDGKIVGLDPSDTVARYSDSKGKRHLAVSNRVALCVPRFIVIKSESMLGNQVSSLGIGATHVAHGQALMHTRQEPFGYTQKQMIESAAGRTRASGTTNTTGTAVTGRIDGLLVTGSLQGTAGIDGRSALRDPPQAADGPLQIIKWPDRLGGLVGDVLTFTLKATNTGGQPISNIAVTDSLTNRLEYLAGSAKADRDAVFTTQPNDAGSLVLRWEFSGALLPRESAVVTFKVRIR